MLLIVFGYFAVRLAYMTVSPPTSERWFSFAVTLGIITCLAITSSLRLVNRLLATLLCLILLAEVAGKFFQVQLIHALGSVLSILGIVVVLLQAARKKGGQQ